jgi:tetratricopeptide (TPR) repeat protein
MKPVLTALAIAFATTSTASFAQPTGTMYGAPQPAQKPSDQQQAPATQTTAIQPSNKARQAIANLQTAVNANDVANIPARLAAAQAVAATKEDRYWIGRLQLQAAAKANDVAGSAAAIESIASSGLMPAAELSKLYGALGGSYYNAKQYDQAVAAYQRQLALDPTASEPNIMIAEVRAAQGKPSDAATALQRTIQANVAAGRKPEEAMYRRAVALAYEAKAPNTVELSRQWLAAYPSPSSWQNSIAIYRNLRTNKSPDIVDILRLAMVTGALQQDLDYQLYAEKAYEQANYGEAKAAVDAGIAAGKLKTSDKYVASMMDGVKGKVPSSADLASAEKGAAAPTAFLRVGDRYYGAGNYAKAAELYRQALAKGVDKDLANLRLGEALARSGDKAGATVALNTVSGTYADAAKFWLIYVQRQA